MSELVKRIARLQLIGDGSRAQCHNEGLMAAIHIIEEMEQPTLNSNQQIVLEYGKTIHVEDFLEEMTSQHYRTPENIQCAMNELDERKSLEVMKMVINWALDQC